MKCIYCGSEDTEVYAGESIDEPDVNHCHECGSDEQMAQG